MNRASWSAISKDSEIWKKIALGAGCLSLILPTPVALGIVNLDLEAEAQRRQNKLPPGTDHSLPKVDDLSKLVGGGIGPSLVYGAALMMFAIATIPVGLSYFQLYAAFRPPNELVPELHTEISLPIGSLIVNCLIGLVGLTLQTIVAASLPVALAQYARGKDLRPALAVLPNALTVLEMGFDYWTKASGVVLGMLAITALFITGGFGLSMIWSTLGWFLACGITFVGLILAGRHALDFIATEVSPAPLPPLE